MMKLRAKKFLGSNKSKATKYKSSSKGADKENSNSASTNNYEIEWEVRPGGMLVQKRSESCGIDSDGKEMITIKIFNVSQWHDISIEATSTFGDLKKLNSLVTGLHPRDQRVLYKGKERKDEEHLHLVGAGDKEKMLLLEDPTNIREKKLRNFLGGGCQTLHTHFRRTIIL